MYNNKMNFIFFILIMLVLLIMVSFLSLLEQKELSYMQLRKGPNKAGMMGLLQPFCDAIKLFSKEFMIPLFSNYKMYYFSPIFSLVLSLMIWILFPLMMKFLSFDLSFLFLISVMSMGVYFIMFSGWSSNSNYSLLGGIRSIAQTLSYEICLVLFFFSFLFTLMSLNLKNFFLNQFYIDFFFLNFIFFFIMMVIFLSETNRSPFDFAEGESELVSGFNTEYSSGGFALIFMAEYSSILFMSMLICLMMFMMNFIYFIFFMKIIFISFCYIWVRASFPRFRYDLLMYLTWKKYLPISLNYLIFFLMLKFLMYSI